MPRPVAPWLLERFALGELPPDRHAEVEAILAADPEARAALDALREDDAAFLAAHPPAREVPRLLARARPPRRAWVAVPALAAAAAATLFLLPPDPPDATERIKGGAPSLRIFRKDRVSTELLADGDAARAGDRLQLAYLDGDGGYGVIVSIDGRGVVTPQLGDPDGPAAPLVEGKVASLQESYELDDAPDFERFFLVTADHPFDAAPVFAAARALAGDPARAAHDPLPVSQDLVQVSVTLHKEHP